MKRTPEAVELMRAVADQIDAEPECYDQSVWECGTQRCVAGWACVLAARTDGSIGWFQRREDRIPCLDGDRGWYSVATALLGLEDDEANGLFGPGWVPAKGLSVADALRKLAAGADLEEVSDW